MPKKASGSGSGQVLVRRKRQDDLSTGVVGSGEKQSTGHLFFVSLGRQLSLGNTFRQHCRKDPRDEEFENCPEDQ